MEDLLATSSRWEWDAFQFAEVTQNNSLAVLGYYLFHINNNFSANYNVDTVALTRWVLNDPGLRIFHFRLCTAGLGMQSCAAFDPLCINCISHLALCTLQLCMFCCAFVLCVLRCAICAVPFVRCPTAAFPSLSRLSHSQ